jgi:hypothetical protein
VVLAKHILASHPELRRGVEFLTDELRIPSAKRVSVTSRDDSQWRLDDQPSERGQSASDFY